MRKVLPITPQQEEALRKFLHKTKNARERERARALVALFKGRTRREVAEIFEVNPATLDVWKGNFRRQGVKGIQNKGYKGNHSKLSPKQKKKIKKIVYNQTPQDLGLSEKRFWNTKLLAKLIEQKFKVVYDSPATYRKLFYSFGFSCHKPGKHNRNQNPHLVEKFRVKVKKRSDNTKGWAVWSW